MGRFYVKMSVHDLTHHANFGWCSHRVLVHKRVPSRQGEVLKDVVSWTCIIQYPVWILFVAGGCPNHWCALWHWLHKVSFTSMLDLSHGIFWNCNDFLCCLLFHINRTDVYFSGNVCGEPDIRLCHLSHQASLSFCGPGNQWNIFMGRFIFSDQPWYQMFDKYMV